MKTDRATRDEQDPADATAPLLREHLTFDPSWARYFRRATRLLSLAARLPIAAVTFTDSRGAQRIVSHTGLEAPLHGLLLRGAEATVRRATIHQVPELGKDDPVDGVPAGVRAFAGVAIRVGEGRGVLCGMGPPRVTMSVTSELAMVEIHAWLEDTLEALRIGRIDHLTGLANRRELEDTLEREWRRGIREATPVSLLAIDIDHFKGFNDTYGHPCGDEALCAVATALRGALRRPADVVGRIGGEEFLACLPGTDAMGAAAAAEAMREAIVGLDLEHARSPLGRVTISIGCAAAIVPEAVEGGVRAAVAAADRALYEAKAAGRNRTLCVKLPQAKTVAVAVPAPVRPVAAPNRDGASPHR